MSSSSRWSIEARRYAVRVAEREQVVVEVEPGAPSIPPPSKDAARKAPSGRLPGWLLLGAGGGALGTGATFGLLAADRNSFMNDHCDASRACDVDGLDAGRTGRTYDVLSTVSFITAGVLVTGAVAWLVTR